MKDLLIHAREEIIKLRRENEILQAKIQTAELLGSFLHAQLPKQTMGFAEKIA